ncbi:unnamed protein product [Musa acuminata subsp. burmannicoides]
MVGSRSGLMSEVELPTAPLGWPSGTLPRDRPKAEARVRGGSGPLPAAPLAGSEISLPRLGIRSGARDQRIGRGRRPVAGADEPHHRGARVLHVGRSFHQTGLLVYCIQNK